jgi:hypothetical protein
MNRDFSLPSLKPQLMDTSGLDNTTLNTLSNSGFKPNPFRPSSRENKKRLHNSVLSDSILTLDHQNLYKDETLKKSFG